MADTPDAIPAFATAARSAILAPMPPLENNATQPWLIAPDGNVVETIDQFGSADQHRKAALYRQTTLRNHHRRTCDLLLPGQVNPAEN